MARSKSRSHKRRASKLRSTRSASLKKKGLKCYKGRRWSPSKGRCVRRKK